MAHEDFSRSYPCPCGQGTVTVTITDYNNGYGTDVEGTVNCRACASVHRKDERRGTVLLIPTAGGPPVKYPP